MTVRHLSLEQRMGFFDSDLNICFIFFNQTAPPETAAAYLLVFVEVAVQLSDWAPFVSLLLQVLRSYQFRNRLFYQFTIVFCRIVNFWTPPKIDALEG